MAVMLVLALGGCASEGAPINGDTRPLSPEEMRLQNAETKIADLTRRVDGLDSNRVGPQIADDVRELRGQVEQMQHDLDVLKRQQQDQYRNLDTRLQRLEAGGAPAAGAAGAVPADAGAGSPPPGAAGIPVDTSAAPVPPATVAPPPAPAASTGPQEDALYNSAFGQLKAGRYDDAIRGFRGLLDQYPQGNFADNAWYWMGESYYVKGDNASALQSFQSLLERFPASPKVPDALLETGLINLRLNKTADARTALQRVVRDFPNSNAATTARSRLAQLK